MRTADALGDAIAKLLGEPEQTALLLSHLYGGQISSPGQADDRGDVFRPRAPLVFMAAAEQQRIQLRAASDIQRADTFRAVKFMRGNGEQIHAPIVHVHRLLAE